MVYSASIVGTQESVCGVHKIRGLQRYFVRVCMYVCVCVMWRLQGEDQTKTNPAADYSLDTDFLRQHALTTSSCNEECDV